jgi:hypothetical protein
MEYCTPQDVANVVAGLPISDPRVRACIGQISRAVRHYCNRDFTVIARTYTVDAVDSDYLPIADMLAVGLVVTAYGAPLVLNTDYRLVLNPDGTGVQGLRRLPWGTPWAVDGQERGGAVTYAGTAGYDDPIPDQVVIVTVRLTAREWTAREGDYSEETGDSLLGMSRPPVGWNQATERDLAWYVRAPVVGIGRAA